MKVAKCIFITIFVLLILFNIGLSIFLGATFNKMSVVVLLTLVLVLTYKKRICWIIGVCLFSYGVYYFLFIDAYKSSPGALEFTSTLETFLFGGYTGNPLRRIIHFFPLGFYAVALVTFLTTAVRKQYHIKS